MIYLTIKFGVGVAITDISSAIATTFRLRYGIEIALHSNIHVD